MHSRRVVVAVVFLLTMSAAALAGPFTSVIAYGDSLSDNGNLYQVAGRPPSPPYFNGRFSNGPSRWKISRQHLAHRSSTSPGVERQPEWVATLTMERQPSLGPQVFQA